MHKNKEPAQQRGASGNHHDEPRKPASSAHIRPVSAIALEHIRPHPHNARTHSRKQIRQIAASIQAIGFASPVLIDEHGTLLAGHGRLEAAKLLAFETVPAIVVDGLTEARKRALLLADNRIAQNAGWNREAPLNRGGLNSTHIHGTRAPAEEPSTASKADIDRWFRNVR